MRKKGIASILILMLSLGICNVANADASEQDDFDLSLCDVKFIDKEELDMFRSNEISGYSMDSDIQQAEKIMRELGIAEDIIFTLPEDKKLKYLESQGLEMTTAYYAVDSEGNAQQVSKAEHDAIVASYNNEVALFGGVHGNETVSKGAMTLGHIRNYIGNGRYVLSANLTWSTLPGDRNKDVLSLASDVLSFYPDTQYGQTTFRLNHQLQLYSFDQYDNEVANSHGYAVIMKLPYDPISPVDNLSNLMLHVESEATVPNPTQPSMALQSTAQYFHQIVSLDFTPSVGWGSGSISLSFSNRYEEIRARIVNDYTV